MNIKRLLLAIVVAFAITACSKHMSGTYVSTRDDDMVLELNSNGSFYFRGNAGGYTGKYSINDTELFLKGDPGIVMKFTVRGDDTLVQDTGEIFKRQNVSKQNTAQIQTDLKGIMTQLKLYDAMNGFFPTEDQGLQALVSEPTSSPKPSRWYQLYKEVPKDPWGSVYVYKTVGSGCDVFSAGPDKLPDTDDDIRRK